MRRAEEVLLALLNKLPSLTLFLGISRLGSKIKAAKGRKGTFRESGSRRELFACSYGHTAEFRNIYIRKQLKTKDNRRHGHDCHQLSSRGKKVVI